MNEYYAYELVPVAHAQTWTNQATAVTSTPGAVNSNAATVLLTATSEVQTGQAYSINLPVVIPITIGLAVFFFLFGWLMSIATGRRK